VQRAPGIPCALFIPARLIFEHLGRIAPRDRGVVFSASHVLNSEQFATNRSCKRLAIAPEIGA
jgi:hypothetical protein